MEHSGHLAYTPEAFLAAAIAECKKRGLAEGSEPNEEFLYKYLRDAQVEDFATFPLEEAASLALDLWQFALESGDERKIRIRPAPGTSGKVLGLDIVETVGRDIAFLVDSTIASCVSNGAEVRAVLHPILELDEQRRSLVQIPVTALSKPEQQRLLSHLQATLTDVELINADFKLMRERMLGAAARVRTLIPRNGLEADEISESADFLDWLGRHHFTFLGVRDYSFPHDAPEDFIPGLTENSNLGILRDENRHVLTTGPDGTQAVITPRIHAFLKEPRPVIVAKSNMRSRVHRDTYADYIGVKRYDAEGRVVGETRFVGLFTSEAYNKGISDVPLIRRMVGRIKSLHNAGSSRHSGRALHDVLENFPRDELFQIGEAGLLRITRGILELQQRPRPRLFIRRDQFDRFVSVLMFTPRDQYSGQVQQRIHTALAEAYGGRASAAYPSFSDGPLARVHFIIGLNPDHAEPDEAALEQLACQLSESWADSLAHEARRAGIVLSRDDASAFSTAYAEKFGSAGALEDLQALAGIDPDVGFLMRVYQRPGKQQNQDVYCKLYHYGSSIDLSEIVPVLEHMGLRVRAESEYRLNFKTAEGEPNPVWMHDIVMASPTGQALPDTFADAFTAVWTGQTENDGFNALVIRLGVSWREAALLRTLCRYRQQTGLDPSQMVQINALMAHENITRLILKLFAVRFDPDDKRNIQDRGSECAGITEQIEQALEQVSSLDEDRILRRLASLVSAIMRTNFYQQKKDGQALAHIAIKIASRELDALPAPKPYREIFVWSPSVEGVHLRFGPVARGGLRWSDRRDDFRTEVLGLVKAQQVKNAVIVPVGSKGGFFPKQLPRDGGREQILAEGQAAYKVFISALIDLTDNIHAGKIVHPSRCVIWDGEDPYLVVAADKGTATFSDIANGIATERNFWLGDAFASGGSEGYDHKKMGITARGAWEAIKRHFRELGKDIQSEPFTVIGVGDMSGDVFGNGMLLSEQTRLLAAFNHLHIFIDPDPDPAATYAERKRLFDLPRSGWNDYDKDLISQGGGVFERSAKSIPLSPQIQAMTGLTEKAVPPDTLIAALVKAKVELLWFGGVGTYIKAHNEQNLDVGDKANDLIRADAKDVRARIIGEGANLGVTQAGRIEFASGGGRINTDAVDNSAGVDCSDHEVNIKILLSGAIEKKELKTGERNALLAKMTEEVGTLVLKNNYDQTGALTRMQTEASALVDAHEQLMLQWENRDVLDRAVEGLPSGEELNERRQAGTGLTRPELSVLMAYAKIDLFNALASSKAPDDPAFEALLTSYFPTALSDMTKARSGHRLRREIIATLLSNRLVNVVGMVFPYQLADTQGVDASRLTCAMEAVRCIFDADTLFGRIDKLDNTVPADAQSMMCNDIADALGRASAYLCTGPEMDVKSLIETYYSGIEQIRKTPEIILSGFGRKRLDAYAARYEDAGAPADIARDTAYMQALVVALEAVDVARISQWPIMPSARIHSCVGQLLGLDHMRSAIRDLELSGHWENLALQQMDRECPAQIKCLCLAVIAHAGTLGVVPDSLNEDSALITVDAWLNPNQALADTLLAPLINFSGNQAWSLARLVLAEGAVRDFVRRVVDDK